MWVFVVAGVFEVLTGDPLLHALLLFVVGAVLLGDGVRGRLSPARRRSSASPPGAVSEPVPEAPPAPAPPGLRANPLSFGAVVAAVALFAAVVGSFRRFTLPVTLAVGVPAGIVLVWAWRATPRRRVDRPLGSAGVGAWLAVFVGLGLWELVALSMQPALTVNSSTHPTISVLLDPVFAHHLGRSVGIGLWVAIGWFLVEQLR